MFLWMHLNYHMFKRWHNLWFPPRWKFIFWRLNGAHVLTQFKIPVSFEVVNRINNWLPDTFILENVITLLSKKNRKFFNQLIRKRLDNKFLLFFLGGLRNKWCIFTILVELLPPPFLQPVSFEAAGKGPLSCSLEGQKNNQTFLKILIDSIGWRKVHSNIKPDSSICRFWTRWILVSHSGGSAYG